VKKAIIILSLFLLQGCESAEEKQLNQDKQTKEFIENTIKLDLVDPSSLQLRNIVGFCGEANSKNRLGGYVGFKRFIVINDKKVVYETERNISTKEFTTGWDEICKQKPKFDSENMLIKPNFKLPEPTYDPPSIKSNGKTIAITPSELVMDGNYNYIYPELIFRCDEGNKLDLTLISMMEVQYDDGYLLMLSTKDESVEPILLEVNTTEIAQSFIEKRKLFNYLKNNNQVNFAFKSVDGKVSLQSYNLKPVKDALAKGALKCSWY
jgi:hypothetical protein